MGKNWGLIIESKVLICRIEIKLILLKVRIEWVLKKFYDYIG